MDKLQDKAVRGMESIKMILSASPIATQSHDACGLSSPESPSTNTVKASGNRARKVALLLVPVIGLLLAALFVVVYLLDLREVERGISDQYAMLGVPLCFGVFFFLAAIIILSGASLTGGLLLCRRFQQNPLQTTRLFFWLVAAPLEVYAIAYSLTLLAVSIPELLA